MSSKGYSEWESEEDEDEEDFVPDAYEEEGDDCVEFSDDEDDPEDFPPILQGEMFIDENKGLCYEQDGIFCLVCKSSIPTESFSFATPVMNTPLVFAGWIKNPGSWMEFEVHFSKEPMSKDPLEIKLLEEQEEQNLRSRSEISKKNYIDDAKNKTSPGKCDLKAPPSYSLENNSGNIKYAAEDRNGKQTSSTLKSGDSAEANEQKMMHVKDPQDNMVFVVSGSRITGNANDDRNISFRGSYRFPLQTSLKNIHLICSIQTIDSGMVVSGATASTAAAGKKRNRPTRDDDSVEESTGEVYQELIDLHDDTRLSTEELRKKYYGTGDMKGNSGQGPRVSTAKRFKETDYEGEDDDAYGF
ncbi:unnamed protein product [Pseudo-nitzschia multistriata]|uniref:Uncharacterized protein n=1 Tax=Pseudo-nitzschia multistriata TaxID=183589 RepID=A0A448Z5P7_9STRA|nr:unnamed protein product [Pseudo-nitzschia multistriata]